MSNAIESSAHTTSTTPTSETASTPPTTGPARARVEDVTAVVLTRPDGPPLGDLLTALAGQHRLPQRVLVAGPDPQGAVAAEAIHHPLRTRHRVPLVLRPPIPGAAPEQAAPPLWRVLEDARGSLPVHPGHWLWVLTEDSRPEPGALAALAAAVRRNSRVAVVAPKLVHPDDPRLLVGVGHHLTPGGRVADLRRAALLDQGQLDLRQDVLGAPLPGSLVRSDLLEQVGGIDPSFGEDGVAGLDLGWRSHLAGQRVVVAPDAVVRQGEAGLGVVDPRRTRVRQRQVALARGSALATPVRRLGIGLTSLLAALLLLLVKRPHDAADELSDVRAVLSPVRGWGARWRFRRRRTVRPRDLRSLFLPRGVGWRSTLDVLADALDPRAGNADRRAGDTSDARETGPVSEELADLGTDPGRSRWSWPLVTALLVAGALVLWQWQRAGLLGALAPSGAGVAGGELGASATGASGLWRSALDGWRGGGLGHDQPPEPWLVPASAVAALVERLPGGAVGTSTAGVALGWILLLAVPAAVVAAHVALRRVTHRRWVRAALAVGWVGLGPLPAAVGEGRVGPAVVHVAAPLLVAGYAVAATPSSSVRRTAATFATALLAAVTALWVTATLVVTTLAGVALVLLGGRSVRARGAVLALLPWALLLPWLPALWAEPVRLLGGAGATVASATHPGLTPAWQLLLLHPGPPVDPATWSALPLWGAAVLWLAALAGTVLGGRSARRAGVLVGGAVLALALGLLAPRLALGELSPGYADASRTVTVWPGTMMSLTGAALLLAAGLLLERTLSATRTLPLTATVSTLPATATVSALRTATVAVVVAVPLVAVLWSTLGLGTGELGRAADPLPAVAAEQARGPSAQRTLVLRPVGADAVPVPLDSSTDSATPPTTAVPDPGEEGATYRLAADLQAAEPEPARILRDRARDLVTPGQDSTEVTDAVAALAGRGTPADAAARLHRLGVGFVQLRAPDSDPVAVLVDRLPGLTRVSSPADQVLWRVAQPQVARLVVRGPDGEVLARLPMSGPHGVAAGTLEDLPEGSQLEVAEGAGWSRHATVTVDGTAEPVPADGVVALPAGTHEVVTAVRPTGVLLHLVALGLAAVTAFLALPFGRTEDDRGESR